MLITRVKEGIQKRIGEILPMWKDDDSEAGKDKVSTKEIDCVDATELF